MSATTIDSGSHATGVAAPGDFRLYLGGQVASTFGTVLTGVATSVLAVQLFDASAMHVGLLAAAGTLPALVVGPLAGVLADRTPRPRRLLIGGELAAAVAVSVCGIGLLAGVASFAWLVVLAVALGLVGSLTQSVFFTHLNSLGGAGLPALRARLQTGTYVAGSTANAVGGSVVAFLGPAFALLADALSYLLSAAALRRIGAPDHNPAVAAGAARPPESIGRSLLDGAAALMRGAMRPVVLYALVVQATFAGTTALKALFLLRDLAIPVAWYGVPGVGAAAFGVFGSVLASRLLTAGRRPGRLVARSFAAAAAAGLLLPAAGGSLPVALTVVCLGVGVPLLFAAAANIALVAVFTEAVPERLIGRATASLAVVSTAATALGAVLVGWLGQTLGVRPTLWVCAVVGLLALPLLRPLYRPGIPNRSDIPNAPTPTEPGAVT